MAHGIKPLRREAPGALRSTAKEFPGAPRALPAGAATMGGAPPARALLLRTRGQALARVLLCHACARRRSSAACGPPERPAPDPLQAWRGSAGHPHVPALCPRKTHLLYCFIPCSLAGDMRTTTWATSFKSFHRPRHPCCCAALLPGPCGLGTRLTPNPTTSQRDP